LMSVIFDTSNYGSEGRGWNLYARLADS
jgi:hypothetical protein